MPGFSDFHLECRRPPNVLGAVEELSIGPFKFSCSVCLWKEDHQFAEGERTAPQSKLQLSGG